MRTLMLLENCTYPEDTRVRQEAEALVAAGHRVTVICPGKRGQPRHAILNDVTIYRYVMLPSPGGVLGYVVEYGWAMLATWVLALYAALRHGMDVIHAHNPPDTFVLIAVIYKLFGVRFLFDHHDLAPEMYVERSDGKGNRWIVRALEFFEALTYRAADHIIVTNESCRLVAQQRGGMAADRVTVVRNGPDLRRFQDIPGDPRVSPDGRTIIGYVGVMGLQDGLDYLVSALDHLVSDLNRTDIHCILVGGGDVVPVIQGQIEARGLGAYVQFVGWVEPSQIMQYLARMDICVAPEPSSPYHNRSTAIKVMEYMAAGKPTVAFALPEHQASARDSALYAQPNDTLEFAQKIAWLIDHPAEREALGRRGRQIIEQELAWSHQVKHLLAAYEAVSTRRETRS